MSLSLFLFSQSDNTTGIEDVTGGQICSYTEWIPCVFWIFLRRKVTALASLELQPEKVTLMECGVRVHISRYAHCCHLPRASLGHICCKPSPWIGFKNFCFLLGKICPPLRKLSSLFFWLIFLRRKELWTSPNTTYVGYYPGLLYLLIAKEKKKIGKFWKQSFSSLNPSGEVSQSFFSALLPAEEHTGRATT